MRGSVVIYLVCLSVVPMLGLGLFATLLVRDARAEAAGLRRLEAGMQTVRGLDDLRLAMLRESTSSVAAVLADQLGVPLEQLRLLSGIQIQPAAEARATTDAALEGLTGDPGTVAAVADLRRDLTELRRSTDAGTGSATPDQLVALTRYGRLMETSEALEISAAQAVSGGRYGKGDVALSQAAGELTGVAVLAVHSGRRASAVYDAHYAGQTAESVAGLRLADASYRSIVALFEPTLTGELADRWRAASTSDSGRELSAIVAEKLRRGVDPAAGPPSPFSAETLRVGRAVAGVYDDQQPLLARAVERGLGAARADRTAAADHARNVVLAAVTLAVVTAALLSVLGGAVRRRLSALAGAAHDLSSGRLTTVELRGPREISVAGQGLNDAARSLERVLVSAERLAAGDLTATELSRPLEGRLGAAVTAAFGRVTEAMEEREQLQRKLAHQATHDVLTGLPNRGAAQDLLDAVVDPARVAAGAAVLFIDLDRFKVLNDTYGHAAGDHVLQASAARMSAQLRPGDTLCRIGGDEFVAVLSGGPEDAAALGDRIVAAIAEPIPWDAHVFAIGASVGIAVARPGDTADGLLARADHAVYRAKAEGRGTVQFAERR